MDKRISRSTSIFILLSTVLFFSSLLLSCESSKPQDDKMEKVEKVLEYTRTRNKIEFHGVLKSKLYKAKFNEEGVIELDEKGKPVPVLDENGNKISWVRRNTEGLTVNDFVLEVGKKITTEEGQEKVVYTDYIPMLAYGAIAWQVAKDIDLDTPVLAQGYVRCRPKNGFADEVVYEPVITRITPLEQE